MSGETPIYDATCRDVGAPDGAPPPIAEPVGDDEPVTADLEIGNGDRRRPGV